MLTIERADTIVARIAPKEDHVEDETFYAMDCRVVIAVMKDAKKVLEALRVPTLSVALWDDSGVPTLQEAQIKLRHRVPNVAVLLEDRDARAEVTVDVSQVKIRPLPAFGLEVDCKLKGRVDPADYIAIWAMKIAGKSRITLAERQMDIDSLAA